MEKYKAFAISVYDGRDTYWDYMDTIEERDELFNKLKLTEGDIHTYILTELGYEVDGGYWDGDEDIID